METAPQGREEGGALPPATLIICSRNRPEMLAETVASVLAGDEVPAELVVVDQSDDPHPVLAHAAPVRGCEVRYLWTRSTGLSRANNLGIAAARHEVLVFTHDDVRVAKEWFGTLVRALVRAGPRCVVTGKVPPTEPEVPGGFQQTVKTSDAPEVHEGRTYSYPLLPLNMALYRGAFEEVGGFDERLGPGTRFPGAEDADLGFRLLEAGYRILYVPSAVAYHRAWRAAEDYLSIRWSYGVALGAFFGKHLSLRDRHVALRVAREVKGRLLRALHAVRRERREAAGHLLSVAGIFFGAGRWMLAHRLPWAS